MDEIRYIIDEVAKFLDRPAGVIGHDGVVIKSTAPEHEGTCDPSAPPAPPGETIVTVGSRSYASLRRADERDALIYVEGTDETSKNYLQLIVRYLRSELKEDDNESGRIAFLKNVLLENELPGDIPLKAREHKVVYATRRQALLITFDSGDAQDHVTPLSEALASWGKDYILPLDESNIVVLLELGDDQRAGETVDALAQRLLSAIGDGETPGVSIGIGLVADTLKEIATSYREASLALTVGAIFESEKTIMRYDKLGLGRLIYQLPPTLCQMFLSEVFRPGAYEALDADTLLTIQKFFENNLNGSETSRQLFVHRNTLVYRLDKVQKITKLDLRNFDDAVLFKLATMVRRYLEKQGAIASSGERV